MSNEPVRGRRRSDARGKPGRRRADASSEPPRRRSDARDHILETAWALTRERGVQAVTVADIAAASGVSRQLIYHHFDSKSEDLMAMKFASASLATALASKVLPVPGGP